MKPIEIEAWALKIVDAIKRGAPHEDSRVECKAEWIGSSGAARRIAAHANAAGGEPILWLIGLDRQRGVVGAADNELSNWWSSVQSEFNEIAPSMADLLIPIDGKTIVALLFETDRAPFVVKAQAGYLEVPWREGTRTNSARRSDLVRLLAPVVRLPQFEVRGGSVELREQKQGLRFRWNIQLDMYVLPSDDRRVVIPFHYVSLRLKIERRPIAFIQNEFHLPRNRRKVLDSSSGSPLLKLTGSELIADGPGYFIITSEGCFSDAPKIESDPSLKGYFRPAGSPVVAVASGNMIEIPKENCLKAWAVGPRQSDLVLPWPEREE